MAADEPGLSAQQKELVALSAGVGSGCHLCVGHHLEAGAKAGVERERLLAALASAERVAAEAAVMMGDHLREALGPAVGPSVLLSTLEEALTSFGAALGAKDAKNVERQMRAALHLGASRMQLRQAIEAGRTVQENAIRIHVRESQQRLDALAAPAAAVATAAGPGRKET